MSAPWVISDEARDYWIDAPADDDVLWTYLNAAQIACEAYAPALDPDGYDGATIPDSYKLAVIAQARSTYRAVELANQDGGVGPDGLTVTVFPLDWQVKQLLRPQNPRPVIA